MEHGYCRSCAEDDGAGGAMSHCPGCRGYTEEDDANGDVYEAECPGVTCPQCAEREREKAKWGVYPCEQCAAKNQEITEKDAEIARLQERNQSQREQLEILERLQDEEIAEHVRLTEEAKDAEIARLRAYIRGEDNTLIDELNARIDHLRALVAVGREMADAVEVWPGSATVVAKWRSLEVEG